MEDIQKYEKLIEIAVKELSKAVEQMLSPTSPHTPLPRPRRFHIIGRVYWPYIRKENEVDYHSFSVPSGGAALTYGRLIITEATRFQPRLLLRALRRLQAAKAWCQARAEGRKRMAEEIIRQQARAVETLEAELVLVTLGK